MPQRYRIEPLVLKAILARAVFGARLTSGTSILSRPQGPPVTQKAAFDPLAWASHRVEAKNDRLERQ